MGKETTCHCDWGSESFEAKVLLETHELVILPLQKGALRRRLTVASLTKIEVDGDKLQFHAGANRVCLTLGVVQAQSWFKKLTAPSPTLSAKLGVTSATHLALIGEFTTTELTEAVAQAAQTSSAKPNLVLAHIRNWDELNYALDLYRGYPGDPPIWIIYRKGSHQPIGETEIRSTLRHEGMMDTKVASVSASLTALRFIKRS